MYLDFNNFKAINDLHGHKYGDLALIEIAHRLSKSIRSTDMVSRLGGDEFIVLLRGFKNPTQIKAFAKKILRAFQKEIWVGKRKFLTTVSIGIAIHPKHGKKPADLLHHADVALYNAKKAGGNKYEVYSK